MWEFIDKVVYINLDHRQDRRDIMAKFFEEGQIPQDKIVRVSAVKQGKGIGCLKSHAKALELARENKWKNVLILEDDLQWFNLDTQYSALEELTKLPKWDVIQLVGWYMEYDFPRIYKTLNAGAYLVNNHYYDTLLANRYGAIRRMNNPVEHIWKSRGWYTADVYWHKLSAVDNWYGLYPCICRQVDILSDNTGSVYKQSEVHGIYPGREMKNKIFTPIQNARQKEDTA